jgi:hypothetical protein
MAARNKLPSRRQPSPHDIVALHLEASGKRDEMREQARKLRATSKMRAADRADDEADGIDASIAAFEEEFRAANGRRDPRFKEEEK